METRIRERLRDLAEDAPAGRAMPPALRRRARWRMGVTLVAATVAIAAGALGVSEGLRLVARRDVRPAQQPEASAFDPVRGWIAVGGFERIVAVDPADPSNTTELSVVTNVFEHPLDWSADGTMLLVARSPVTGQPRALAVDLLVRRADGTETLLARHRGIVAGSFSPDGTEVVFSRFTGQQEGEAVESLFVVPTAGGPAREIETGGEHPALSYPAWSPDGQRVYYIGIFRDGADDGPGLAWTNADGSGDGFAVGGLLLDEVEGGTAGLTWSPDGTRLAFAGTSEAGHSAVYVVNADGSGLTELAGGGDERYAWPTWSPDGSRIAFVAGDRLMTMSADGSDVVDLGTADGRIAWNPVA